MVRKEVPMSTTHSGHQAPVIRVTRTDIIEDEHISDRLLREQRIPRVSFNVDTVKTIDPRYIFRRVGREFQKLGLKVECIADNVAPYETYSRAHLHVSNHRTGRFHMEKLVVVLVEGKFVSVTALP